MIKIENIFFLTIVFLSIFGCSTFQNLSGGLQTLVGEDINCAFNALGYPNDKKVFGGDVVYIWENYNNISFVVPTISTTTGTMYVNGSVAGKPYNSIVNYNTTNTGSENYNIYQQCRVQIITKDGSTINSFDFYGNQSGCQIYNNRIQKYLKNKNIRPITKRNGQYRDCVEKKAPEIAKTIKDFESLVHNLENICRQEAGYFSKNLARFYARSALEKK